jgi:hypothetical protein
MSEFNIKFGTSSGNRVIQRDSGTNITLKSTIPASNVQRLTDVDMNNLDDGAVLVYSSNTNSFVLKQFLSTAANGAILFDAGADF